MRDFVRDRYDPMDKAIDELYADQDRKRWLKLRSKFEKAIHDKNLDVMSLDDMHQMMFMPNGKTPRCQHCGKGMHNYVAKIGKFKGQLQRHSWVCSCPAFMKLGIVLSVG